MPDNIRPRKTCCDEHAAELNRRSKRPRGDMYGGDGMTLAEVGLALGNISRERVRQIEAIALKKLHVRAREMGLHEFLDWIREREARMAELDDERTAKL